MNDDKKLLTEADHLTSGKTLPSHVYETESSKKISDSLKKIQFINQAFKQSSVVEVGDLAGKQWDRLKIIECIGKGGVGSVYKAFDQLLDRFVALKVLHPSSSHYVSPEKFVGEAKRMAQVRHPHIMAVYGAGIEQGFAGYWGELLKGKNLKDYLATNDSLDMDEKLILAVQLVEAVAAIHRHNLAHGDIKCLNIMIENNRGVVLMDFGSSVNQNKQEPIQLQPMTPLAMAPEQFAGKGPSQTADIFSLGVVLYYLFNHQYPFKGDDYESLKFSVQSGQIKPFGTSNVYTRKTKSLLDKMLIKDPSSRLDIHQVHSTLLDIQRIPINRSQKQKNYLVSLLLATITAFSWFMTYQTKQSNQQLIEAKEETDQVNDLLTEIIRSPSLGMQGENILLKDVVKQKIAEVENNKGLSTLVRNRMYLAFSQSLGSFGELSKQAKLLEAIIDDPKSTNRFRISAMIDLISVKLSNSQMSEAKQLLERAERDIEHLSAPHEFLNIDLNNAYAQYHLKRQEFELAKQHSLKSMKLLQDLPNDNRILTALLTQGQIQLELSEFESAKQQFKRCIEIAETFTGQFNWNNIACQTQLARAQADLGQFDLAIKTYQQVLPNAIHFLGNDSVELFKVRINYGSVLSNAGKTEQAIAVGEQNLADAIKHQLPESITLFIKNNLTSSYINLEMYEKAEQISVDLIPALIKHYSASHVATFQAQNNLAEIFYKTDRPKAAIETLNTQIPLALQTLGESHIATLEMQESLSWSYHMTGRDDLALPLIEQVWQRKSQVFGSDHPITEQARLRLEKINNTDIKKFIQ